MINREYLEIELPAQIQDATRPLAVTLVLRGGTSFRVRRLGRVGDGYATFEICPPTAQGAIRGGRPSGEKRLTAGPGPHWVVVAFESISHVTLSVDEQELVEVEQPGAAPSPPTANARQPE